MDGIKGKAELLEKQFQLYVETLGTADTDTELMSYERPKLSIDDARKLFNRLSGLAVDEIKELDSFWDRNFYISTSRNQHSLHLVMKVLNANDSANLPFVQGLIQTLLYLGDNGINCPKPVKLMDGKYISRQQLTEAQYCAIYMQIYIEGFPLGTLDDAYSPSIAYSCGVFLGNMDNALKDFCHHGFANIRGLEMVPTLKHHLHLIEDESQRQLAVSTIQSFEDIVIPNYKNLRRGIIHGDFNPNNIIVKYNDQTSPTNNRSSEKYSISGVIDFGNSVYSCYLFEVAIAMCHFMMACPSKDRVSVGEQFQAGFESRFILNDSEKTLLDVCVAGRAIQNVMLCINELKKQPYNEYVRSYLLSSWEVLTLLHSIQQSPAVMAKTESFTDSFEAHLL
ncbi:hydroxylysine kinase-like [Glandiceps talaboti]